MTKHTADLIWKKTPADFRGTFADGTRYIMVWRNGSTLVPVDQLTDAEVSAKLGRSK